MIETILTGCCVALSIGLMVEKAKNADLKDRVKSLKRQLIAAQAKGKQDVLAAKAYANTNISTLQMNAFHQSETIYDLREQLAYKERLLQQKWIAARE